MVDKEKILAGRKAVDAYHEAHNLLHSKPWHKGVSEEHTPLVNAMLAELQKQGFNSVQEFQAADKAFREAEYNEELQSLKLPPGAPIRFVDVSNLTFEQRHQLHIGTITRRLNDAISDTLFYSRKVLNPPVVVISSAPGKEEIVQRALALGAIPIIRDYDKKGVTINQGRMGRLFSYIWQNYCTVLQVTKNRLPDIESARNCNLALGMRVLQILGVPDIRATGNNVKTGAKKLAVTEAYERGLGFYVASFTMTVNLDYIFAQQLFPEQSIHEKVTSLNDILGSTPSDTVIKDAVMASARAVFNSPVIATWDRLS